MAPRLRRSNLSELELQILMHVAREPQHGYALMQKIAASSQGSLKPGPGSLYVALRRLLTAQFVAESNRPPPRGPGRKRRCYRITLRGQRAMTGELRRLAHVVRGATDAGWIFNHG